MKGKDSFFLIALFFNSFGNNFYYIALPLLVYNLSNSAVSMGIMGIIEVLPIILLGPLIGTLVDRWHLKKILCISALVQAILMLGICLITELKLNLFFLYFLGSLVAINVQFFKVGMFSSIPFMFQEIEKGNAKISSINSFSDLFAPFVASLVIAQFDIRTVFILNSITSLLFFIVTLRTLNMRERSNINIDRKTNIFVEAFEGIKSIRNNRPLVLLIWVIAISNLGDAGLIQLLMYRMANDFNLSNSLISLIIGISGIGAFAGTLTPYLFENSSTAKRLFWGLIVNNIGVFFLLINHWIAILVSLMICNLGGMVYYIAQSTLIQLLAGEHMIGRINGTVRLLIQITKPISLSILMFVANQYGSYSSIIVSVLFTILTTIILFFSKLKELNFEKIKE